MSDADKPKIEGIADEVALWNFYRETHRVKGFDIAQFYADLAAEQKRRLTSPGAREDFAELRESGCLQLALAALVALLRYSPLLERFWTEIVGRPDNREKATRILQAAAQTLQNLFSSFIALENEGKSAEFTKIGRRRSFTLGAVSDMTLRQARKLAEEQLRPINQGILLPQSTMDLRAFVDRYFEPLFFPTLKRSTQKRYRQTLNTHLLPAFGKSRLCDIGTLTLQSFVLQKMESGLGWESANHLRNLTSRMFETAR
jgi:hypothetical protein